MRYEKVYPQKGTPRANPTPVAAGTGPRVRRAALRDDGARRTPSSPWLPGPRRREPMVCARGVW